MRFWDSSSLVAFLVEEPTSRRCRDLYRADFGIAVWTFARHEVWGGICRKWREARVAAAELEALRGRLERFSRTWHIVLDSPPVREGVDRLLERHELRTADALQLAAALVWAGAATKERLFVSGDDRLLLAAAAEGFTAIRPAAS